MPDEEPTPEVSARPPAARRRPRRRRPARPRPAAASAEGALEKAATAAASPEPATATAISKEPAGEVSDRADGSKATQSTTPRRTRSRRRRPAARPAAKLDERADAHKLDDAQVPGETAERTPKTAARTPKTAQQATSRNAGGETPARTSARRRAPRGGRQAAPKTESTASAREDGGANEPVSSANVSEAPALEEAPAARRQRRSPRRPRTLRTPAPFVPRTMVVSASEDRTQIAVLEERDLVEHYVTHSEDRSIAGNVYLGRVQNVLPGMEAAFVDIGEVRNAVLYAGEVTYDEEVDGVSPRIETILKPGQSVLTQVTKDPMGSKGARLTTEVSIAGRYLVMVPGQESLGISRRLSDDERHRLRDIASEIRPKGFGLIVRTAAQGAQREDLERDAARLVRIWKEVESKMKKAKPPQLVYSEPALAIRVVRDLFTGDVERVVVEGGGLYDEIREYVTDVTPALGDRIEKYEDPLPAFERHHIVEQVRKALDRKVWLRSGGHIVIDRTEALTVVDVNTGGFVGKSSLEETVLHTNLEAADEVAKQLRLRDIGGIIVIDFIDMMHERNRDELLKVLRNALAKDKTRTQVFGISELGLVQMTRKNVSEGLLEAYSDPCEACGGRGVVLTEMN